MTKKYELINFFEITLTEYLSLLMQIVHLSHLHVGSQFQLAVFEKVVQEINQLIPDAIVITGDLTDESLLKQYEECKKLISKFDTKNYQRTF